MIEQKEITVFKSQVSKLENQANELTITNADENAIATELKAKLKTIGKTIKDRKEKITKPLNEALKSARQLFAPLEEQFESAENIVGRKLLAYKQKVDAEIRAKEEKIARDAEAGKIKLETAEKKIEKLDEKRIDTTVRTSHGQVQFRKIKKVRFVSELELPTKAKPSEIIDLLKAGYLVWDQVKARKDALAGVPIIGTEVYEEETV